MSDITISVIQPPSTTINVGVDETTLIQAGIGLPPHSVTHISGGSDEINHNLLGGLQGGSGNEFYHLNSGQYFNLVTGSGAFYPNSNPSGFITGVDLTPYATVTYVTGVSGQLQAQITILNNQTGSFYPRTNPSGFITGINNIVYTTGNQIISGAKTFTGSFNVSTNDAIIIRSTGYTNGVEIGGGYFNKIADGGFINDFGVGGTENHFGDSATSSNSFGGSAVQNDFGAYATLNNYYGGSVIGELIFDTAPTFSSGEVRDLFIFNSLGATQSANPNTLVTRSSLGYSEFSATVSTDGLNRITYDSNKINLFIDTGDVPIIYDYYFPQENGTLALDSTAVMLQGNQIVNGVKNFTSIPTVNNTGILLSGSSYITGISGGLQTQITTLNNQTGSFYPNTNPSGYISGISNLVFTTGNQTISGAKTFANNLTVNGGDLFVDTSNNRVGIGTASPITTLDVNGSGLFRSGLNANLIISTGSPLNILGKDNAAQAFPGNFIGASINLNAGSGNFIPGSISLKAGAHPTTPGAISLNGGLTASNIPEGKISLNSKSIEVNNNNSYASSTIFYKTGFPFASENINISQNSISINNNLLINGNRPTVNSTGILLSGEATTQSYVTGISGGLQTQITTLNNQTGSYYPRTNPSGYITGVDLSFSGNYYTKDESESRYVNTTGAETILGDKTFHDKVYINNLYVTGLETIINTTNTNVASNYIMLNLTGGAVDGGIFFVTGSGLTGINDSGAIIGFDHSDEFKFGIGTRASDLSTLNTIAAYEQVTGISGGLQTQISTLNNATGNYVLKIETGQFYSSSNPSGYTPTGYVTGVSGNLQTQITNLNNATGSYVLNSQTGQFYANSNPSGFITGVDLSSYATQTYVTGISGDLQSQITNLNSATGSYVLNSQTGQFYASSNPSGFITGIDNIVFTTGNQTISGIKTFSTGVNVTGDVNINGNLTISGQYNVYQQIENAKILSIAYAIAL
jgi:hypothetical protein